MNNLTPDGQIIRHKNTHIVRGMGRHLARLPGVICENPRASIDERIYRKVFRRKRIFVEGEIKKARRAVFKGVDVVFGLTGYSKIGARNCAEWGVTEEAYLAACDDLLMGMLIEHAREFPNLKLGIADGASTDLGVDKVAIQIARRNNIPHLGHSCPMYMFYVADDDDPVYVGRNNDSYGDAFVQSLDILLSVGGRLQALKHDIYASVLYNKQLLLLNVLRTICKNGSGPPARDRHGKIVDATAAFEASIHQQLVFTSRSADGYADLRAFALETAKSITRKLVGSKAFRKLQLQSAAA